MRGILFIALLFSTTAFSQWKDFRLNSSGDTLNRLDHNNVKHGEWVVRHEALRGEPGYEEEGVFIKDRKEGEWRLFNLMGDLIGIEHYKWGLKDGVAQYFAANGALRAEQGWKALNPDKLYDTILVEELDKLDSYKTVVVKNEGAALKHGNWKYYDANTGALIRSEMYTLGKLEEEAHASVEPESPKEVPKPKEVLEFEKKNSGKKKIRYRDGSTGTP